MSYGRFMLVALGAAMASFGAAGQCPSGWPQDLAPRRAVNGGVNAMVKAPCMSGPDRDGTNSAVVIAGEFTAVDGEPAGRIALLAGDGSLAPLGAGFDGPVFALAVLPTDAGNWIVAAGAFTKADGAPAGRVAAWDGSGWQAVGGGFDGDVRALAIHDDGAGPALYAGGAFTMADGAPASRLARWDGTTWAPIAGGVDGGVYALASFDDGGGPALFVGGSFLSAGGVPAKRFARLRNGAWSALGASLNAPVHALEPWVQRGVPVLSLGGEFTHSAGQPMRRLAWWDGVVLVGVTELVEGPNSAVKVLESTTVDGEPSLIVGGAFPGFLEGGDLSRIARWNGAAWAPIGKFDDNEVRTVLDVGDESGPDLLAGGSFERSAFACVDGIARWDGAAWRDLREEVPGFHVNGWTIDACTIDGADGPELVVAGTFDRAGGRPSSRVARFHGGRWHDVGPSLSGRAYDVHPSMREPGVLYVAGAFEDGDGDPETANGLLRWDGGAGSAWTVLANVRHAASSEPYGYAVIEFDDGTGPAIWLGGLFDSIDGVPTSGIARLDGHGWSAPEGGLSPPVWGIGLAFESFDDGTGEALYVGGIFDGAGDVESPHVVRWSGDGWSPVGIAGAQGDRGDDGGATGAVPGGDEGGVATGGSVWALRVHDDGSGPALYAGGYSLSPGSAWPGYGVHRLRDGVWSEVGAEDATTIYGKVRRLVEWNSPDGMRLVAVGDVDLSPTSKKDALAWNGSSWTGLTSGVLGGAGLWGAAALPDGPLVAVGWFRNLIADSSIVQARNIAVLEPSGRPWITAIDDDLVVRAGDPITLHVRWALRPGNDLPMVTWRRDGANLDGAGVVTGAGISTLTIAATDFVDAGAYDAVVENDCGAATSAAVVVAITCAADIDLDGVVGGDDLGRVLAAWGRADPDADLDGDGVVGAGDVALLMGGWGGCG